MNYESRLTKILMTSLLAFMAGGCQSTLPEVPDYLTMYNFKNSIYATKEDATFHYAVYDGPELKCFPPIHNPQCRVGGTEVGNYTETGNARVEQFSVSVNTKLPMGSDHEFLYLVSSEITIQRGFKYFTLASIQRVDNCRRRVVSGTSGSIYSGLSGHGGYSATSTSSVVPDCKYRTTFSIYLFDDDQAFVAGLFSKPGPYSPFKKDGLLPVMELYNFAYAGANPMASWLDDEIVNPDGSTTKSSLRVVRDAWKIKYDAVGLSADIRKKNGMGSTPRRLNYKFVDFAKRNADAVKNNPNLYLNPLENNRSTIRY